MGALVGDAAGAVLEFTRGPITEASVEEALQMRGGGAWAVAPGQITDDGELTLSLLSALVESTDEHSVLERAARAYAAWVESRPFDIGTTTRAAFGCLRDPEVAAAARDVGLAKIMTTIARARSMGSKANGSLMRATPLGVWGARRDSATTAQAAMLDARLSHPSPTCVGATAAYVCAIRHLVLGGDVDGALAEADRALDQAEFDEVRGFLKEARDDVRVPYTPMDGFVRIGFTHAFRHLIRGTPYVDALRETLLGGGDTDTNACIVGGLLGARWGASALPRSMVEAIVSCDTRRGAHPRPEALHPRLVSDLVPRLCA